MEILKSLGVDWTVFVHLGCFAVAYVFLNFLILKPYLAAHHERQKRTVGNEETALRLIEEANKLQSRYEQKAKAINHEIKSYYDQSRTEAMSKHDQLISAARAEAGVLVKEAHTRIEQEIGKARAAMKAEIPAVSSAIASRLAGKEITV